MKVYFFLSRKRLNKKGVAPIVCRISANQTERDEFRTGIFIAPKNWDSIRGLPLNNENHIYTRLSNIANEVYRLIAANPDYSPNQIVLLYKNKPVKISSIKLLFEEYTKKYPLRERMFSALKCAVYDFISVVKIVDMTRITTEDLYKFYSSYKNQRTADKKIQQLKRFFTYAV